MEISAFNNNGENKNKLKQAWHYKDPNLSIIIADTWWDILSLQKKKKKKINK